MEQHSNEQTRIHVQSDGNEGFQIPVRVLNSYSTAGTVVEAVTSTPDINTDSGSTKKEKLPTFEIALLSFANLTNNSEIGKCIPNGDKNRMIVLNELTIERFQRIILAEHYLGQSTKTL